MTCAHCPAVALRRVREVGYCKRHYPQAQAAQVVQAAADAAMAAAVKGVYEHSNAYRNMQWKRVFARKPAR